MLSKPTELAAKLRKAYKQHNGKSLSFQSMAHRNLRVYFFTKLKKKFYERWPKRGHDASIVSLIQLNNDFIASKSWDFIIQSAANSCKSFSSASIQIWFISFIVVQSQNALNVKKFLRIFKLSLKLNDLNPIRFKLIRMRKLTNLEIALLTSKEQNDIIYEAICIIS